MSEPAQPITPQVPWPPGLPTRQVEDRMTCTALLGLCACGVAHTAEEVAFAVLEEPHLRALLGAANTKIVGLAIDLASEHRRAQELDRELMHVGAELAAARLTNEQLVRAIEGNGGEG